MISALDKNTALVIIDLQKGIVEMNLAHPAGEIIAKAAELAAAFRKEGLPVVVVNVNPLGAPWQKTRKEVRMSIPPERVAEFTTIAPGLNTQPSDIFITKQTWNAFFNTGLHEQLQRQGVTGIVICGVSTSIGIEGTARAASELAYNISFATDAMTDGKADAHENSIRNIFPRMGETGTTADIITMLASRQ